MAVFSEVIIPWDGADYTCKPSMSLIRRCEQKGFRLTRLLNSFADGDPEIGMLTLLLSEMLRQGGADVTDDDVGGYLLTAGEAGVADLVVPALTAFTGGADAKKPAARARK
jgi:hypothetical protein